MNILNNTFSAFHFHNKENIFLPVSNSLSTLSTSQISFFSHKPIFTDLKLLETVFKNNSFEIFQFLEKDDIDNLQKTNKFFLNICDCYLLMDNSMKSLGNLFAISFQEDKKKILKRKVKLEKNIILINQLGNTIKKKMIVILIEFIVEKKIRKNKYLIFFL